MPNIYAPQNIRMPLPDITGFQQSWGNVVAPQDPSQTYIGPNIDWINLAKALYKSAEVFSGPGTEFAQPVGIFAGPKAIGFKGATGKFSSLADKMPRFEISDKMIKLKNLSPEREGSGILSQFLDHPTLFRQYPELENIPVHFDRYMTPGTGALHTTYSGERFVRIGVSKEEIMKKNLIHEIQHWIQEKEGFVSGGSPQMFWPKGYRQNDPLKPEQAEEYFSAGEKYQRLAGEIEARDVSNRMGFGYPERQTTLPYTSENIPLSEWIYK